MINGGVAKENGTMDDDNVDRRKAAFITEVKKYSELGEPAARLLERVLYHGATRFEGLTPYQLDLLGVIGVQYGWELTISR